MRIVYVNSDPGIGPARKKGAAVHVAALQRAFEELGHEVLALEHKRPEELRSALEQALDPSSVQLVYERYALASDTASRLARERGLPHVMEVNAPLLEEAEMHRDLTVGDAERARERALFAAADHVFAVSADVASYALALGADPDRVHVHPNAVDSAHFRPGDRSALRSRVGLPREAFVLGFHGRLRPWHGFDRVARAARVLRDAGHDVRVLAFGVGAYEEALKQAGMLESSLVLDWVPYDQVPELLGSIDVLPLGYPADAPCYFSPLKLAEAMACGAVPVVPDLGDLTKLVVHGENGLVHRAGDEGELVRCLELLACDQALRAGLARRASLDARARTWSDVARAALSLAKQVELR